MSVCGIIMCVIIKNIFSPKVSGEHSAEEVIFRRGVGDLYTELRDVLLTTCLKISNTPRIGASCQLNGLSYAMNKAIGHSLTTLGWQPRRAPGAAGARAAADWAKFRPSGLSFMPEVGIAVEVQFGNHYQFNADVQRLAESILEGKVVAGISVVASDKLAQYKADRCASFSNTKEKLERWLGIWSGSGAILLPSIMILGIEYDELLDVTRPSFFIKAPTYNLEETNGTLKPIGWQDFTGPS